MDGLGPEVGPDDGPEAADLWQTKVRNRQRDHPFFGELIEGLLAILCPARFLLPSLLMFLISA